MSYVYTELTLKNAIDTGNAASGMIKDHEIRQTTVRAMADTGSYVLVVNDEVRKKLGLQYLGMSNEVTLADGTKGAYEFVGPVEVWWKNRRATCEALLLPDAPDVLLGAIPMEMMDLIVHPLKEEVVGAHGDKPVIRV